MSAVFFLAIRRYLPVVMFFNDDGAEQPNPFRVSKKIFSPEKNIQCQRARISRFRTIFRLATTKQSKKMFHTKFYNVKVTCLEYVTVC